MSFSTGRTATIPEGLKRDPDDLRARETWYLLTEAGSSAFRIVPGLCVGENARGEITLNDALPSRRWIVFRSGAAGEAWVEVVEANATLSTDAGPLPGRQPLTPGLVLEFPNNRLLVARDIVVPVEEGPLVYVACVDSADSVVLEPVPEPVPDTAGYGPADWPPVAIRPEPAPPTNVSPRRPARTTAARPLRWMAVLFIAVLGGLIALVAVQDPSSLDRLAAIFDARLPAAALGPDPDPAPDLAVADTVAADAAPVVGAIGDRGSDIVMIGQSAAAGPAVVATDDGRAAAQDEVVAAVPAGGTATSGAAENSIEDPRIARARILLEAGKITYPPGENAVELLTDVMRDGSAQAVALGLLGDCTDRLIRQAMEAHANGRDYEARNTVEEVLGFNPENARANRLWAAWVDEAR